MTQKISQRKALSKWITAAAMTLVGAHAGAQNAQQGKALNLGSLLGGGSSSGSSLTSGLLGSIIGGGASGGLGGGLIGGIIGGGSSGGSGTSGLDLGAIFSALNPPEFPDGTTIVTKSGRTWVSHCGTLASTPVKYCFYENSHSPKYTVWFMHGLTDNEHVFNELGEPADRPSYYTFLDKLPDANIVMVSYDTLWLLSPFTNRTLEPFNGTVDNFKSLVMPEIEANFHPVKPYMGVGHSMGGFNMSTLCATQPDMFSKCVLLNAMLPACDPFATSLVSIGTGGVTLCNPGPPLVVKDQFTKAQYASYGPLATLKKAKKLPKTLVTTCKNDEWGLVNGPKAWYDQAKKQGFNVTYVPVTSNCTHTIWPAQQVLDFLNAK